MPGAHKWNAARSNATKQSRDSPLGFLECHKSPAIRAHSVKGTVRNQKKSKIWTHSSRTTVWWAQRHCQTAHIHYAHTETQSFVFVYSLGNPCSENKNYSNHHSLCSNVRPPICLLSIGVWVKEDCEHLRANHGVKTLFHVGRAWWAGPPHCDGTHKAALRSARTPQLSPLLASTDIYHSEAFQSDSPSKTISQMVPTRRCHPTL